MRGFGYRVLGSLAEHRTIAESSRRCPAAYENDHHWNETGHEVAAASLEAYFVDHCEELGLPLENCTPKPDPFPSRPDPR